MKKLSIITINWNDAAGLKATIESVLRQTARAEVEHIVVDGGSTDGSVEVLNEYKDRLEEGISIPVKPIYKKMNIGTSLAKGEYCLFLNSGDTLHDEKTLEGILPERVMICDPEQLSAIAALMDDAHLQVWEDILAQIGQR